MDTMRQQIETALQETSLNRKETIPLVWGPHQVEMVTAGKTDRWQSPSAVDTFRRLLTQTVFGQYPAILMPLLMRLHRFTYSRLSRPR